MTHASYHTILCDLRTRYSNYLVCDHPRSMDGQLALINEIARLDKQIKQIEQMPYIQAKTKDSGTYNARLESKMNHYATN